MSTQIISAPTSTVLTESAAPSAPAANSIQIYAFDTGAGAQLRTVDEYGLIDILSNRDTHRSRRKFYIGPGSDTVAAADLIHWGFIISSEGTFTNGAGADGMRKLFPTAATLDADSGIVGGFNMTRRDFNPDITIKFRVASTTLRRAWIGWCEADPMGADTDATIHKFALRLSTSAANVNYCMVHSDGTTETITEIAATDAGIHTLRLIADNAGSRWGYSLDGAAVTWVTTNIPAATDLMGLQCQIRALEAVAKSMDFWFADGSMET